MFFVPIPWPPGIDSSPEIAQEHGGTRPVEFSADLAQVVALLEHVTSGPAGNARPPHPLFGALTEAEWLRWGYLHFDHHLRQFGA